jgi:anthranilate phosphoribosyltransferase
MKNDVLGKVAGGEDLSMDEMASAISSIMSGEWQDNEIGLLLMGLRTKGEAVTEIAGAAKAMRDKMTRIPTKRIGLLDTCGTGGDASGTFNISTAAAIVTAAAGIPVAKHGNRSITSKTGSADVLNSLGVNIDATVEQCATCLDEVGICFCFAPLMHQSMKHVGQVRKSLGVPTIFNMLGPLCNPAGAEYQLLGVGRPELRSKLAQALQLLGTSRAVVVSGEDGLDEVTLSGATNCTEVTRDQLREFQWMPEVFGLATVVDKTSMQVETPDESADKIRSILDGSEGPSLDIVLLNSAAAIWTTDASRSEMDCLEAARAAVVSGKAEQTLAQLAQASHA